jgi:transporter family protein
MTVTGAHSWFAWAVLSTCFAALTAIFAKIGLEGIDSDFATLVRIVVILVVLTASYSLPASGAIRRSCARRQSFFSCSRGWLPAWVCYFRALKMGDASKVAPIDKLSVVLVALFAVVFLGERPDAREWLGISLVAAGVVVLALKR